MKERIVVTGMGTVNPLGNSVEEMWTNIKAGKSGVGPLTKFDVTEYRTKIAAEIKDLDASLYINRRDLRKMSDFMRYAAVGTAQAITDAGLDKVELDKSRVGVILGNGIGGFEIIESSHTLLIQKGPNSVPPLTIPQIIPNEAPGYISILYGYTGPCYTVATACASGTDALGAAMMWLQSGLVDVVITGGAEGAIAPLGIAGFNKLQALSTNYNDTPEKASRPFDKDRDGFVIGEGAGILVFETEKHAQKRGAKVYAEAAGYGITCDGYHMTAPNPDGSGAAAAMKMALKDANLEPEQIDYINAHGTSTEINDKVETETIKKAFGDHAYNLKISSSKSMLGHLIGAAGGVEAIISIKAIEDQYMPGTINLENQDELCDLNYLPGKGEEGVVNATLSDSLGFGGHNAAVIFKKFEG